MAMNKQRRTANLNNIVTYDTLKNVTLLADLTVEGLTGAGFVKADANGLLSVDTGAYLPIPSQTGNGGKYLTTDGVNLSWGTVSTANIYNSNGTLTAARTLSTGAFNLAVQWSSAFSSNSGTPTTNIFQVKSSTNENAISVWSNGGVGIGRNAGGASAVNGYALYVDNGNNTGIYTGSLYSATAVSALNGNIVLGIYGTKSISFIDGAATGAVSYTNADGLIVNSGQYAGVRYNTTVQVADGKGVRVFGPTGNVVIGGSTFTDAGYLLDVNGTARVSGATTLGSTSSVAAFIPSGTALRVNQNNGALYIDAGLDLTGFVNIRGTTLFFPGGNATSSLFSVGDTTFSGGTNTAVIVRATSIPSLRINNTTSAANWYFESHRNAASGSLEITNSTSNAGLTFFTSRSASFGTYTEYASAQVAIDSTTKGFLPPRMTTTQKNAIATPAAGLQVYDNTLNKSSYYNGTSWVDGGDNIYNSNGTLTGNRTVTMGSFTLSFDKDISVSALTIGKGGGSIGTNTSIGINAIVSNTTGSNNTSIGYDSGKTNTTGVNNTYVGFSSGTSNQNSRNTAVGYYAGGDNTSGTYNTALGHNALKPNTSGSYNIGIGGESGQGNTTGSYNIFIGLLTTALADNQTNQIVIGNQITGLGSNTTIIGTASTITTALRGRLLLGTTTDTGLYQIDVNGTSRFSDKLSVIATATTNDVALFRSVEPYVTIEAVGASNPASIFFRPSTSAQNATIQNRTGGGIDLYTGITPSLSLAVKSSGAVVASSTLGMNGVEDSVKSNTYTPTLTNVSNITSSSVSTNAFRYIRIGNIVYVSGRLTVNATAANTATEIEISLPIASNLTNSIDLSGVATTPSNGYGQVIGDTASDTGSFYVFPTSAGSAPWNVEFSYVII